MEKHPTKTHRSVHRNRLKEAHHDPRNVYLHRRHKRCAIRDHLADANRFGPQAVFMSEDEAFRGMVEQHGLEVAEALQVKAVDAVVVLDTSIGPHTEISKYGDIMMGKTIVFVPEEHKNSPGYAAVAFNALKVEGYTSEQYASCTEIRRKANNYCQALRLMKAKRENKI